MGQANEVTHAVRMGQPEGRGKSRSVTGVDLPAEPGP